MERFVNQYVKTPEMHKELRWKTLNWPLLIIVVSVTTAMIMTLVGFGVYGVENDNNPLATYSFVVAFIFSVTSLQIPWSVILHLRPPKKFGKVNAVFYEDKIEIKDETKSDSRTYTYVKKIKETENFFLIIFEDEKKELSYLPVKKDALNCDPKIFKAFIVNKIESGKEKTNG